MRIAELVDRARNGRRHAIARLLSTVEEDNELQQEIAEALMPHVGHARVIGLTGPPGVGKSTSTSMLLTALRQRGKKVGVVAIDPSSPFSGGALLGDRIRMAEHSTDPGVFIRSMASRGHLGGLSHAAVQAVRVLDATGFDLVLIETVGVGQSEVDVMRLADSTVVFLAPGLGDGVQAAKAGLLEIADAFVVNKADRDGADAVVTDLRQMISLGRSGTPGPSWRQPIVTTVASKGEGAEEILRALEEHHDWLAAHGELADRRIRRAATEIEAIAMRKLRSEMRSVHNGAELSQYAAEVADGTLDPYCAADKLLDAL